MNASKRLQREARWRVIINRQLSGSGSVAGFCRREGLAVSTFHWWRRRLGEPVRQTVQWIEAQAPALVPPGPAGDSPAVRMGNAGGLWIEFAAPPAADLLRAALDALRAPEGGDPC
jgi:hypothetical protein